MRYSAGKNLMSSSRSQFFSILACGVIGLIGAYGEAYALHNSLVHSDPYKMMGMPPWQLYSWIGSIGYYVSLAAAIVSLVSIRWIKRYLVPAVPVIVCPLAYWLVFEIAFIFGGFSDDEMRQRNFDGYTGLTARYEFGFEVLGLIFWGAIIGVVIGFLINKTFSLLLKSPTATDNIF